MFRSVHSGFASMLVLATAAQGQYCWEVESVDPGAEVFIGEQENNLVSGMPWDTDGIDDCAGAGDDDVRCEWLGEHSLGEVLHLRNGVVAAYLDGSIANQDVVVRDQDFWSDSVSLGDVWRVNYDAHFFGVNSADMANLRVIMQFQHAGTTFLTLNLSGSSAFGNVYFVTAPQHNWFDTPETGDFWKIRLTLRRLTTGDPAMIWIDNIHVEESTREHYEELFPIFGDGDYDGDVDLDDHALFTDCMSGEGVPYPQMSCNAFDGDDDQDVDLRDGSGMQQHFSGPL